MGNRLTSRQRWLAGGTAALALAVAVLLTTTALRPAPEVTDAEVRFAEALGVPVTVRLGPPLVVEAHDVPLEGTTAVVRSLRLELEGASGVGEPGRAITAAGGAFTAELDDDAVQQLIGVVGRLPLTDVELRGGFARLVFAGYPVVDATAHVEHDVVTLRPTTPLVGERVGLTVDLDGLPLGLQPEAAEIRRGLLRVAGTAPRLRLPPQP